LNSSQGTHTLPRIRTLHPGPATGGFWSKVFNMQNRKFTSVSCARCHYTEFYAADSSQLGNIFDLFTN